MNVPGGGATWPVLGGDDGVDGGVSSSEDGGGSSSLLLPPPSAGGLPACSVVVPPLALPPPLLSPLLLRMSTVNRVPTSTSAATTPTMTMFRFDGPAVWAAGCSGLRNAA